MTKRDAICEAALELFAEQGIEATTTREITQRAGAAEGTLYRHFEGKADLASQLYHQCAQDLRGRLVAALEPVTEPDEQLEVLIRGLFDFFSEQPTACTYLLSARSVSARKGGGPDMGPAPVDLIVEILEEGGKTETFRDVSPDLVAGWILAMIQRTVRFLKAGTLDMAPDRAVDKTVAAARELVRPR